MELVLEQSQQGSSHEVSVSTKGDEELKRIEQVDDTQPAKETVATDDTTMSLDASESAYKQGKQLKSADAEKEMRESGIKSIGDVPLNEFGRVDANLDVDESPFDTELEIKFTGKEEADSDLESMPGDEIKSLSRFKADESIDDDRSTTLNAEIPELLIKPLNNAFNLLNKKEHIRRSNSQLTIHQDEEAKADSQGEKSSEQAPPIPILWWFILQKKKGSKEKPIVDEPPFKKLRILVPNPNIPSPTPLKLFNTTSSELSLTPPKDDKGNGIASEEDPLKELIALIDKEGEVKKRLKVLSPKELKAQIAKLAAYEVKKAMMLQEDNHFITFRDDPLPIIKISYKTQAAKLGIPLPPQLTTFKLPLAERKVGMKRKRRYELIHEVFVKENIIVDGMQRNLTLPKGVVGKAGMVIKEPKARIFLYNGDYDLVFQRRSEYALASTPQLIRIKNLIKIDMNMLNMFMMNNL
nr:hypothetical protein [Tanacetum cinerariifolium]